MNPLQIIPFIAIGFLGIAVVLFLHPEQKDQASGTNWALLLLTAFCELAAYGVALLFRYVILNPLFTNPAREYDFYNLFLFVVLAFRIILFILREQKKGDAPIGRRDPVEIWAMAIRQHLYLLILLVLTLYLIRWSGRVSRTMMAFLILCGILLDSLSRNVYRKAYRRKHGPDGNRTGVLLLCGTEEADRLTRNLEQFGYTSEANPSGQPLRVSGVLHPENLEAGIPSGNYDLIYLSAAAADKLDEAGLEKIRSLSVPLYTELRWKGQPLSARRIRDCGGSAAVRETFLQQKATVLGVTFTAAGTAETAAHLAAHAVDLKGRYVCFSNVHTTVMAQDDPEYRAILNRAAFTMPDGTPIARKLKRFGFQEAERVAGPDLMEAMFRLTAGTGMRHYFYGSTPETIDRLKTALAQKYPGLRIVGMVSPPFRPLTAEEDQEAMEAIRQSGADFVWVGLGAPKQERWMAAHAGKVSALMLGVGAGFDFHAGTIPRAPLLIQKIGLEWFYRLLQDPKRLFKRYFVTNLKFILYSIIKK